MPARPAVAGVGLGVRAVAAARCLPARTGATHLGAGRGVEAAPLATDAARRGRLTAELAAPAAGHTGAGRADTPSGADVSTRPAVVGIAGRVDAAGAATDVPLSARAGARRADRVGRTGRRAGAAVQDVGLEVGAATGAGRLTRGALRAGAADAGVTGGARLAAGTAVGRVALQVDAGAAAHRAARRTDAGGGGADHPGRARMAAGTAVVDIAGEIDAGAGTADLAGRAGALTDPRRAHAARAARVSTAPAVVGIGGQVHAGAGTVDLSGRALSPAASLRADLAEAAPVPAAPAVLRIVGHAEAGPGAVRTPVRADAHVVATPTMAGCRAHLALRTAAPRAPVAPPGAAPRGESADGRTQSGRGQEERREAPQRLAPRHPVLDQLPGQVVKAAPFPAHLVAVQRSAPFPLASGESYRASCPCQA